MAAAGVLAGQGLALPAGFSQAASAFTANPLTAGAQALLSASGASSFLAPLNSIPGFITGMVPASLSSAVTAGGPFLTAVTGGTNPMNNLVSTALGAGQSFFNDVSRGAASIFGSVQAYATNAFDLSGTFAQVSQLVPGESAQGFLFSQPLDYATGGFSNQFPTIGESAWGGIHDSLQNNMGSYYDPANLSKSFTPGGVVENLVKQGFNDEVLTTLDRAGISYEMVQQGLVAPEKITAAMDTLPSRVFKDIVTATGITAVAGGVLNKFSDTLNVKNLLPVAALASVPSLASLGERIFNVTGLNGSFSTMSDLGSMLSKLEILPTNGALAQWPSQTEWETQYQGLGQYTGTGSGVFGNPKLEDLMGIAGGIGYTPIIQQFNTSHAAIMNSTEGQNLLTALQAAQAAGTDPALVAAAEAQLSAAAAPFANPTNSTLALQVAAGTALFSQMFNKIKKEDNNLRLAEIVPGEVKGEANSVIAFASDLHNVHDDSRYLGTREMLSSITTGDRYGAAIQASVVEGANLKTLQQYGINVDTKFDPVEYARLLVEQGGI